jgi:hypothetical protein
VRYATYYYTDGMDSTYVYALLGDGINSVEEGRAQYTQLNQNYRKEFLVEDNIWLELLPHRFSPADVEKARKDIIDFLFARHIVYFSADGSQILCRSHPYADDNWSAWLDVYHGRELYDSMVIEEYYPAATGHYGTAITPPKNADTSLFVEEYIKRDSYTETTMGSHPYVKDYENLWWGPLFSPDGTYYAYRSPDQWEQHYYENDDGLHSVDLTWCPFGNPAYGFYIRDVETGDTVFYEIPGDKEFETICWVKKDAIEALLAENEGKGPVE